MNSAKRARLAEDEAGMVPPSPMRGSTVHDLRKSLFSTPFKKNAKKYEIGEQKQPLEVVLRVRSLPDDQDTIITHCANNQITVTSKRDDPSRYTNSTASTFSFSDIIHNPSQEEVYSRTALPLVKEFQEGKNCFLFAYGNTNAGKTFTISGTEEAPGILPRMLDTLFSNLKDEEQKEKNKGWRMAIFLSFVEVYGEAFYDLFEPNKKAKLRDQEDRDGNVFIKNLSEKVITSKEEGLRLLHQGLQNRQVAETMLNHDSSRSHSVLTIKISRIMRGVDTETIMKDPRRYVKISKFFVVDLAGSERASRTQNTGARLREAANINTSLMTFRNCVETLRWNQFHPNQNQKVVPFRESKLTRLMQEFFVGSAKGKMIVAINPCLEDFDETLLVLRFSSVAQEVSTNVRKTVEQSRKRKIDKQIPPTPFTADMDLDQQETDISVLQAELRAVRGSLTIVSKNLDNMQQMLLEKDVELANREAEIREECALILAERLQEMEVQNRQNVEAARALSEDKYERKVDILNSYIVSVQERQEACVLTPGQVSRLELAAQLDAEHWKSKCQQVEETLASKDRQVESLKVQLKELSGEKKALSQKLEKDRKLLNEENERVVRQLSERLKQAEEAKSQLESMLAEEKKVSQQLSRKLRDLQEAKASSTPVANRDRSPIPKIIITPPKEDKKHVVPMSLIDHSSPSGLHCEEDLSDDCLDSPLPQHKKDKSSKKKKKNAADSDKKSSKRKREQKKAKRSDSESDSESDEEDEEEEQEKIKKRKGEKKKVVSSDKKGKKGVRSKANKKEESDDDDDDVVDEEEEEEDSTKRRRRRKDENEESEDDLPKPKFVKTKVLGNHHADSPSRAAKWLEKSEKMSKVFDLHRKDSPISSFSPKLLKSPKMKKKKQLQEEESLGKENTPSPPAKVRLAKKKDESTTKSSASSSSSSSRPRRAIALKSATKATPVAGRLRSRQK